MPSYNSVSGRFDMMSLVARQDDMMAALSTPKTPMTPVAKAMKPLAAVRADADAALIRAMRLDTPDSNPMAYRTQVLTYTSGM